MIQDKNKGLEGFNSEKSPNRVLTFESVLNDLLVLIKEQNARIEALEQHINIDLEILSGDIFDYLDTNIFSGKWYDKKQLMDNFLENFKIYKPTLKTSVFSKILCEYAEINEFYYSAKHSKGKRFIKFDILF